MALARRQCHYLAELIRNAPTVPGPKGDRKLTCAGNDSLDRYGRLQDRGNIQPGDAFLDKNFGNRVNQFETVQRGIRYRTCDSAGRRPVIYSKAVMFPPAAKLRQPVPQTWYMPAPARATAA